jgi:hypothetical protein
MSTAIGIPAHTGTIHTATQRAILSCLGMFDQQVFFDGCSDLAKARCAVVDSFLKTPCDYLLFIDSDMEFTRADMHRISEHRHLDIVAGIYPPKRSDDNRPMVWPQPERNTGLIEVERAATGFMQIRRSVFDRIRGHAGDRYFWEQALGGMVYDYFPSGIQLNLLDRQGRRMWLSDDYAFCELARAAGCRVWVDLDVRLGHIGPVTYRLGRR